MCFIMDMYDMAVAYAFSNFLVSIFLLFCIFVGVVCLIYLIEQFLDIWGNLHEND